MDREWMGMVGDYTELGYQLSKIFLMLVFLFLSGCKVIMSSLPAMTGNGEHIIPTIYVFGSLSGYDNHE